ncbi:acetyl-coenzyme A synthetase, cytoplasmic-like [Dendronephthya gigantea]|uniref:acetyl-coenzyme A synthetase, cytoplasmic-like n=1 Tax=Dendronephthya gigantea TaxID=151771 RepID=UPI00106C96FE|nr:acetyl-coenzyme A synthetase, cytoplasmic-like [Dendronephthya gigantea]
MGDQAGSMQTSEKEDSFFPSYATPSLDVFGKTFYHVILPHADVRAEAHIKSMEEYQQMYERSVKDPEGFWGEFAQQFHWRKPPTTFLSFNFDIQNGPIFIKWMEGAQTNVCYNILDRIVKEKNSENTVAFYWEGDHPDKHIAITYGQLLVEVCKFANVLKSKGVKKGDRVVIYLPMIIELIVAMLACARIGAVHSVVFAGFSPQALAHRLMHSKCSLLITADGYYRDGNRLELKPTADKALAICEQKGQSVPVSIVVRHLQHLLSSDRNGNSECPSIPINWNDRVDVCWHDEMRTAETTCEPEWMDAEDPLFILYTSGSTGDPKGVVHTTAGYMLYTAVTFKYVFDYHPGDVFWCTADIGWMTGHSYVTYGPMANGATCVIFEGAPAYPHPSRMWEICRKYKVSKFYTAPTGVRSLMSKREDVKNIGPNPELMKVIGLAGEPINPKAWEWYRNSVGNEQSSVVDTYWQTETGGHVITPLPGVTPMKPGSATFPFFGIVPAIVDKHGVELKGECKGVLVLKQPWPGMLRTLYDDHDRFESVYFKDFPGYYYTGDECRRDKGKYYWIVGRVDDCLKVSGHLLSSAEIESALVDHDAVSEAAAVGYQHNVKGVGVYCYTTLNEGCEFSNELVEQLKDRVREKIGKIATPDVIQFASALPKTLTGKIMRRILRELANGKENFDDMPETLANPEIVGVLLSQRPKNIPGMTNGQ